jgi:hypothetical protein
MNKICQMCQSEKPSEEFGTDKSKNDGKLIYCKSCHREKQKQYYKLNLEKNRIRRKKYRDINKNNQQFKENKKIHDKKYYETHREQIKEWKTKNRERLLARKRELRRQRYEENPELFLLQASKCRATKRKMEHTITEKDIHIPTHCPVLGIPIILGKGRPTNNSPSIDRIDNSKGYIKDNIIIISWRANDLKRNATIEELEKIVNFYKKL